MLLSAYVCCSTSTLMNDLVGITQWTQQKDSAPSVHESLKPLEACNLFMAEGKDSCFVHHYEGLVQSASWVRWAGSTWIERCFDVGANQPFRTFWIWGRKGKGGLIGGSLELCYCPENWKHTARTHGTLLRTWWLPLSKIGSLSPQKCRLLGSKSCVERQTDQNWLLYMQRIFQRSPLCIREFIRHTSHIWQWKITISSTPIFGS